MNKYDVLIVGGGPAGFSAAICLQSQGINSALVESQPQPQNRPGEVLPPGIEPILKEIGILEEFNRSDFLKHDGIQVKWGNKAHFQSYNSQENWTGYQIWRPKFDNLLFDKANELGVDVIKPCFVKNIIFENTKIVGIHTNKADIEAPIIIDATGNTSWIARQLKIPFEYYSDKLIVKYGYKQGISKNLDNLSLTADNNGWIWTAKVSHDLYQWIKLNFNNKYDDSLSDDLSDLPNYGHTRSADVTWRIVSKPSGPGYFIIGDAAFVLDPSSSHGILKAMMSGMMAAHMVSKIHKDSSLTSLAITEYSKWIRQWFLRDVKRLKQLYGKHPNPPKWVSNKSLIPIIK